jgi:hypothetical protein
VSGASYKGLIQRIFVDPASRRVSSIIILLGIRSCFGFPNGQSFGAASSADGLLAGCSLAVHRDEQELSLKPHGERARRIEKSRCSGRTPPIVTQARKQRYEFLSRNLGSAIGCDQDSSRQRDHRHPSGPYSKSQRFQLFAGDASR